MSTLHAGCENKQIEVAVWVEAYSNINLFFCLSNVLKIEVLHTFLFSFESARL